MRNERRMSGSGRGDERPTAETRYGAPTDYNAIKQMRLKRFDGARWVPLDGIVGEPVPFSRGRSRRT